ncbi:hypothetical protein PGTUg99_025402 [Puccinia graminis f. sp. tritici]|uniref:E3 ubiquitin-protein ligase PEP5 n=1 Tax=Puccinia graminis f. sp. tritici TaxID=56615 RepID=A0A5B0RXV5_PUCGR|nr:hypothetical protein PGTUg99_025402 [Puccinia graminis f. sp. tritici]
MVNKNISNNSSKPSPTTWRQFNFFNSYPLHSSSDLANPPDLLTQPQSIATIQPGFGSTILAHLDGRISLLDPSLDLLRSWSAFPGGRTLLVKPTSIKGVLISIGEEAGNSIPILKIWNLRHEDKQSSAPQLLGFSKIQNGNRPHPVTTLALSLNLSYLAVGLADGTVLLYRHLDQALVSAASVTHISRPPPLLPKPKIIYTSPEPITGLAFRSPKPSSNQSYFSNADSSDLDPKPSSTHRHTCLFIVTTAKVLCFFTSGRGAGSGAEPIVMDDLGGSIGCSEMMENGDLILADESALYVYGPEGRGACLAYEGPKARLNSWGNYLVITSPPSSTGLKNELEQTRVIVFDLQNRFIAFNSLFRGTVLHVWAEWGELYVLTSSAEVTRLVERPLTEKLSILYDKDMYVLATNVAKSSEADPSELSEIYRRFGDYLYQKSDFEGAVQQYINTIGTVQPSIVVRKFLDAQRISNLTSYLQELHARGIANADHTTLLLNCYTKLKDHAKLNDFIKANERASRDSGDPLPFDLETAIRVCRQAGYFEPALYLAKQYRQDEEYLRIQVEDRGEWLDAVNFMRSLGHVGAEENLLRYGKALLANLPEETTDLMIDVCSGVKLESDEEPLPGSPAPSTNRGRPSSSRAYLPSRPGSMATPTVMSPTSVQAEKPEPKSLPSIREFFAFFIDQPQCFIRFLETIAWRRWNEQMWEKDEVPDDERPDSFVQVPSVKKMRAADKKEPVATEPIVGPSDEEDREAVWGTLLELYLQTSAEAGDGRSEMRSRALSLLRKGAEGSKLRYEPTQALIVCLTHDFVPGIVLLYDRLGMVEDVLRFWIERAQSDDLVEAQEAKTRIFENLDKYGEMHPELYPIVLRYFASAGHLQSETSHQSVDDLDHHHLDGLQKALDEIDRRKILSPIEVIEILSKPGSAATIGTVKKYLLNQVLNQKHQMNSDLDLINSYRKEIHKKRNEITDLVDKPKIFNLNNKCASCFTALDLPVVHFMCQHSYHQRCLGDQESCLKCLTKSEEGKPTTTRIGGGGDHDEAMKEMMGLIRRNKTFVDPAPHAVSQPQQQQQQKGGLSDLANRADEHRFFVDEVREADDPFGYIASSFSKGML